MKYVISSLLLLAILLSVPKNSFAATIVNNVEELKQALKENPTKVEIELSEDFKAPEIIDLEVTSQKEIKLVGPKANLRSQFIFNFNIETRLQNDNVDLNISNFNFDGENKYKIGFVVQGKSTVPVNVNLNEIKFLNGVHSIFTYNKSKGLGNTGKVSLRNIYAKNNKSSNGGIFNINHTNSAGASSSTFEKNVNNSKDVSSILSFSNTGTGTVSKSYFFENEANKQLVDENKGGGAFYISIVKNDSRRSTVIRILDSYFINNNSIGRNGGAIYIEDNNKYFKDYY